MMGLEVMGIGGDRGQYVPVSSRVQCGDHMEARPRWLGDSQLPRISIVSYTAKSYRLYRLMPNNASVHRGSSSTAGQGVLNA